MKKSILILILSIIFFNSANAQKITDSLKHGVPKPRTSKIIPKSTIKISNLPSQMFSYKNIQIYQNSMPDSVMMPFEIYIDTVEFKRFIDVIDKRKLIPSNLIRYCIHFPGNPSGSETICGALYPGDTRRFVDLEWGREFYEAIYKNYEVLDNFYLYCEDQANLVFFHEAGHALHCMFNKDRVQAEKEACTFEREWRLEFKNIFYFKEFKNISWDVTMKYIEKLRR